MKNCVKKNSGRAFQKERMLPRKVNEPMRMHLDKMNHLVNLVSMSNRYIVGAEIATLVAKMFGLTGHFTK